MGKFLESLKQLESWFERQKRVLPWRNDPSFYRVWISEIMLQQTQVVTVIPYFEKFIQRFPTVQDLSQAEEQEVLLFWAGLGYYSRARNLHRGAQEIVRMGRFPQTREEWESIPGVGPYTAGAILSIAADQAEAILDGNVERVLSRVRRVSRHRGDAEFKNRLWRLSRVFVESANLHQIRPSVLNQALMELGATICTPKKPRCQLCPLALGKLCRAYEMTEQELFPPKKAPKKWIEMEETLHCVISTSGKVLLRRRSPGEWRAGLWDFLETDPRKTFPQLEFSGEIQTKHVVTRHKIRRKTQVWRIRISEKKIPNEIRNEVGNDLSIWKAAEGDGSELRWVSSENPEVPVGSALKKTLKMSVEHVATKFSNRVDD